MRGAKLHPRSTTLPDRSAEPHQGDPGLEADLGGQLFRRKPCIELSDLGRAVQPHLEEIASAAEKVRHAASAVAAPALGDDEGRA